MSSTNALPKLPNFVDKPGDRIANSYTKLGRPPADSGGEN